MRIELLPTSKARVFLGTFVGTLICVGAALFVDSFNFENLSPEALRRAILVDILLPTSLAGPLLFLLLWKMRQLAIAHDELSVIASTDSLTSLLNRRAFIGRVKAHLDRGGGGRREDSGALLIIDADHFKSINDRLGHDVGDQALRVIAHTIRGALRRDDILARIGGEEFAVFLPGAMPSEALQAAERICQAVRNAEFVPNGGGRWPLSVSIGGATFDAAATYDELFRVADKRLYSAKAKGRDRVDVGGLRLVGGTEVAAPAPPTPAIPDERVSPAAWR